MHEETLGENGARAVCAFPCVPSRFPFRVTARFFFVGR